MFESLVFINKRRAYQSHKSGGGWGGLPSTCLDGRQEESTMTNLGKKQTDSHKDEFKLKMCSTATKKTPTVSFKQAIKSPSSTASKQRFPLT